MNETDLAADLVILIEKHKLKACVFLAPVERNGEEGTTCVRLNVDEKFAAKILTAVAEDLVRRLGNW